MGFWRDLIAAFGAGEPESPPPPLDLRQADGRVEVARLAGAIGEPNRGDPRFRRFSGWLDAPAEPAARRRRRRSKQMPPLMGRAVIVSAFLGRGGKGWSATEIAKAHAALVKAAEWIERQAQRWRAPVNIELADTYFEAVDRDPWRDRPVAIDPIDPGTAGGPGEVVEEIARLSRAAAGSWGCRDADDLVGRVEARLPGDHRVWLVHQRSAGRSIAIPADLTELPGVTMAIGYAREEDDPGPLGHRPPFADPVTFVHELLHLFGALDKYDEPLSSYPRGLVGDRDVMVLNHESLSRLQVDRLTAAEIGWARLDRG